MSLPTAMFLVLVSALVGAAALWWSLEPPHQPDRPDHRPSSPDCSPHVVRTGRTERSVLRRSTPTGPSSLTDRMTGTPLGTRWSRIRRRTDPTLDTTSSGSRR